MNLLNQLDEQQPENREANGLGQIHEIQEEDISVTVPVNQMTEKIVRND